MTFQRANHPEDRENEDEEKDGATLGFPPSRQVCEISASDREARTRALYRAGR